MSKAVQCSSNHMANFPIYIDIHTFASAFIKKHVLILLTFEYYTYLGRYIPTYTIYIYIYVYIYNFLKCKILSVVRVVGQTQDSLDPLLKLRTSKYR